MKDYEADATLSEELQYYHEKALEYGKEVIGYLDDDYLVEPSETEIPNSIIKDSALIDLINDVQLYYSNADISATQSLNNNANLYRGDIKRYDVSLIYKYDNTLYKLEITGKQLKEIMEWSYSFFNTSIDGEISINEEKKDYNYYVFAGVNYEVNLTKEVGSRIENLTRSDGAPIEDSDEFTIAVNNYFASSYLLKSGTIFKEGEELPKLLESDIKSLGIKDLIIDYIANVKNGIITASCDNNWYIVTK